MPSTLNQCQINIYFPYGKSSSTEVAPSPSPHKPYQSSHLTLYDHLSSQTLATLERLLHSFAHEPFPVVRREFVDRHRSREQLHGQRNAVVPRVVLAASVPHLSALLSHAILHALKLIYSTLNTLPSLPAFQLPRFPNTMTLLATSSPSLFAHHLPALLHWLPDLILPSADPGPTLTVACPFPSSSSSVPSGAFTFAHSPPTSLARTTTHKTNRTSKRKRECLGGMEGIDMREAELGGWLEADIADAPSACTNVKFFLTPERTALTLGQLCTDLEQVIQAEYHQQLFSVLIPTLEAPESMYFSPPLFFSFCPISPVISPHLFRPPHHPDNTLFSYLADYKVPAHAAAALINFCDGVERDTLIPYLGPIVGQLFKHLNPASLSSTNTDANGAGNENGMGVRRYVQEQVITTLAMVAGASEDTFAQDVETQGDGVCRVDRDRGGTRRDRPGSQVFVEQLIRIQNSPVDPGDVMLPHYLIATWAKICQTMGPEFEPFLPAVMPQLLRAASVKADVSIYEDEDVPEDKEGHQTITMDGKQVVVRTSSIDEKCQVFETLVIYVSTLGTQFAPYLSQMLELVLPILRFYLHHGVREACAILLHASPSNLTPPSSPPSTIFSLIPSASLACQLASIAEGKKRRATKLNGYGNGESGDECDMHGGEREELALAEEMEDFALENVGRLMEMFEGFGEDIGQGVQGIMVVVGSVRNLRLGPWDNEGECGWGDMSISGDCEQEWGILC
ncbi:uncharacterized protein STEHIDRAFT_160207 [Stereum hirsutum FP-91666 SS1]|uniref:uncharacterized protein n=1 Tax=Stereum hirsutum (strain FP-91666) TaxID=721885 RepID=UPI0004449504|nr:uncharacterized protein STEHIDRAFT_160207 [Stereum hirsutum FP-91666 SS1]EIM83632.1 hypothetical protein STEHIDRAFT_160207 [Stereum hirsutum FP-91666 SS1]